MNIQYTNLVENINWEEVSNIFKVSDLKPFLTTMLTAAPGKSGFYEKLGWHKQRSAYILPRSEEQKRSFTEIY
jgi:hypothetical protein